MMSGREADLAGLGGRAAADMESAWMDARAPAKTAFARHVRVRNKGQ